MMTGQAFVSVQQQRVRVDKSHQSSQGPHKPFATIVRSRSHSAVDICSDINSLDISEDDRKYWSILPPFRTRLTGVQRAVEGVHVFSQPLRPASFAPDIRIHMHAVDNEDGTMSLVGALAPTRELCLQLQQLGKPVKHIILPNTSPEHWLYGPALSRAFPDALLWVVPGFLEGKGVPLPGRSLLFGEASNRQCLRVIPDSLMEETHEDFPRNIEALVLNVPFFIEAAVYLKNKSAIVLADTAIKLAADDPEYENMNVSLAESIGIYDRLGPITRVVQEKYSEEALKWCNAVLAKDFDMVLCSHGSPVVNQGKKNFRECFDFLFQPDTL
jgi:hypothetical protein